MKRLARIFIVLLLSVCWAFCSCSCEQSSKSNTAPSESSISNADAPQAGETTGHSTLYLFGRAISNVKQQLVVSIGILVFMIFLLSMTMFISEHIVQPEVYKRYSVALMWTIVKCVQDPGEMAPGKPKSIIGKISAFFVGTLNVAIFAIPAGVLSSGFVQAMEEEKHDLKVCENIERIHHSFRWTKSPSDTYFIPPFVPVDNIITKQYIAHDDILEAVQKSPELQLYNLAKAYNTEDAINDRIVVVASPHNRPYGYCIDRGSTVTIVSPAGHDEPITSWFAYHVAKMGGFNYIAKSIENDPDNPLSYVKFDDEDIDENLQMFLDDLNALSSRDDSWVIPMAFCIGPKTRLEKIHICYSSQKGDCGYGDDYITFQDTCCFERFYSALEDELNKSAGLSVDKNKYYKVDTNNLCSKIECKNGFFFRAECHVVYFDANKDKIFTTVAQVINETLGTGEALTTPEEMTKKSKTNFFSYRGYSDYRRD